MAKLKDNSSHYSGKVGAVVECQWKGIRYIRSLPSYVNDHKTPAQLSQRSKFKAAHRFVKAMLCTVNIGYAAFAIRQTAYNACLSHTLRQVAKGQFPEVTLDYSKALLGEGALAVAQNCNISITNLELQIQWNNGSCQGNGDESDSTILALYCVERNEALQLFDSAQRGNEMVQIKLPTEWQNCTIQCFMGFRSIDHKEVSNICHVGKIFFEKGKPTNTSLMLEIETINTITFDTNEINESITDLKEATKGLIPDQGKRVSDEIYNEVIQLPQKKKQFKIQKKRIHPKVNKNERSQ